MKQRNSYDSWQTSYIRRINCHLMSQPKDIFAGGSCLARYILNRQEISHVGNHWRRDRFPAAWRVPPSATYSFVFSEKCRVVLINCKRALSHVSHVFKPAFHVSFRFKTESVKNFFVMQPPPLFHSRKLPLLQRLYYSSIEISVRLFHCRLSAPKRWKRGSKF